VTVHVCTWAQSRPVIGLSAFFCPSRGFVGPGFSEAMEGLEALKISEEKKKYIIELLNPVLEEMVADCIHKVPMDPVPFMLDWMVSKQVSDADRLLSSEDKEILRQQNQELEAQVAKVKGQMQEAVKMAADPAHHNAQEEEDEEDDDNDEPPEGFGQIQTGKARTSVSAEAYGEWNAKKAFVPPVISKSEEQKDRLKTCILKSFLFSSLESNDINICLGAMKEVNASAETRVINQGDDGDFLFVIESGKLDCLIKLPDGSEKPVKTCGAGDVFGELALLYNCPRAASVVAKETAVLWQLDRDTFNHIVREAAQKKRTRYDSFLSKVPLLASMDAYERANLADALRVEIFTDGQTVVSQGEVGTKFYIIEEGNCLANKNGVQVMSYNPGDYFGELALIKNQPRAASVVSKGTSHLLSVDSEAFKRLFAVNDLLERSSNMYN